MSSRKTLLMSLYVKRGASYPILRYRTCRFTALSKSGFLLVLRPYGISRALLCCHADAAVRNPPPSHFHDFPVESLIVMRATDDSPLRDNKYLRKPDLYPEAPLPMSATPDLPLLRVSTPDRSLKLGFLLKEQDFSFPSPVILPIPLFCVPVPQLRALSSTVSLPVPRTARTLLFFFV